MRPTVNPYESLRRPGIFGTPVTNDFDSFTVISSTAASVRILSAAIDIGKWDYGYIVSSGDTVTHAKYPGEGSGWFASKHDAMLCALGAMRTLFDIGSEQELAIQAVINRMTVSSLF